MILYSNGSNHTAAAEAVNTFIFAENDKTHWALKRAPHPDNLRVSWSMTLASVLKATFITDAQAESSNARIIQTTKEWITRTEETIPSKDVFMIIQFAEWDQLLVDAYKTVFDFHCFLDDLGYRHVFFNGNNTFFEIPEESRDDFGDSYITPYLPEGSFDGWLQLNGFNTVITSNYHYGPEAHAAWSRHVLKHINDNEMV